MRNCNKQQIKESGGNDTNINSDGHCKGYASSYFVEDTFSMCVLKVSWTQPDNKKEKVYEERNEDL